MKRRTFGIGLIAAAGATAGGLYAFWPDAPAGEPLSLVVEQDRTMVPAERISELWALVKVAAEDASDERRPPINVALVIDSSASMEGDAIAAAREAAAEVVGALADDDRLTIVSFGSSAELLLPSTPIDSDARDDALERITKIEARGTTDLAGGLHVALGDVGPFVESGRVTRVLLLSDGVPNDVGAVSAGVSNAAGQGITITALGFGLDYDETLLGSIARDTGGSFHYVENAAALVPTFKQENERLQGVIANAISVALTTGPNVRILEVAGQTIGGPQQELSLTIGDLSRGEERVVGVRLEVGTHRDGAPVELLDVAVRYFDPRRGAARELQPAFISARATTDRSALAAAQLPVVAAEAEQLMAAASLLEALAASRGGDSTRAKQILNLATPKARAAAKNLDNIELAEQAAEMDVIMGELEPEAVPETDAPAAAAPAPKHPRTHRVNEVHQRASQSFQARTKK